MSQKTIYLVGDAILDNFLWLSDRDKDLRKVMQEKGYIVYNYASDDTRVDKVINGVKPRQELQKHRQYPYPVDDDGIMYPLKLISGVMHPSFNSLYQFQPIGATTTKNDTMVVLSMGGNDIRENILHIIGGAENLMKVVINDKFIKNYDHIVKTVKKSCKKLVLVSLYLPYLGKGSAYGKYIGISKSLMERWHKFIVEMGKDNDVPILDLGRTLDYNERSHYGTDDTRPSNIASECMAHCLDHIHKHYSGYKVYYAPRCDSTKISTDK